MSDADESSVERVGLLAPETVAAAREAYEAVGPAAQTVTREVARAMSFDREEYRERVSGAVVATARDALFASLLSVSVGPREAYDAWVADHPDYEVHEVGSEHVDGVVWHAAPAVGEAVAATYQNEREAAVATLRRQAFGRLYRPLFEDDASDGDGEASTPDGEASTPDGEASTPDGEASTPDEANRSGDEADP